MIPRDESKPQKLVLEATLEVMEQKRRDLYYGEYPYDDLCEDYDPPATPDEMYEHN